MLKVIPGYEGYYSIDNTGRVFSLSRAVEYRGKKSGVRITKTKIVSTFPCKKTGKPKIQLFKAGKKKTYYIHLLMSMVGFTHV